MAAREPSDKLALSLTHLPATSEERRLALAVAVFQFVACGLVAPFAPPVPRIDGFIPVVLTTVCIANLITAVLLFNQFVITASRALLVLANGYLFCALIVVPHALTFPGAFAPKGLLGAGVQSSGWLNVFWQFGFLVAVAGYTRLKDADRVNDDIRPSALTAFCWSVVIQIGLVCALTLAVTAGDRFMPRMFLDDLTMAPLGALRCWNACTDLCACTAVDVGDSSKVGARSVGHGCDLHGDIRNDLGGPGGDEPLLSWMVRQSCVSGGRFNGGLDSSALRVDEVIRSALTCKCDAGGRAGEQADECGGDCGRDCA
jgi:hypothetical protein